MKFAEKIFPKGTFPGQETDGAYINETLAKNLDVIAEKMDKDMTFLGIISGHDSVGNGKSTMLTHVGSYLTYKINEIHKTDLTFTDKNMCLNSKALVSTSHALPKLSVIGLDEGDDLTTHGMKEVSVRLKRYFRKCRQLNQILIVILPSFFELPKFYALSRSHFLIDVEFQNNFDRGYFKFYSPKAKKQLYLRGKREWDYDSYHSNFKGRFFSSYCFFPDLEGCIKRYKKKKYDDMLDDSEEYKDLPYDTIVKNTKKEYFCKVYDNLKGKITHKDLTVPFGVSENTLISWYGEYKKLKEVTPPEPKPKDTEVRGLLCKENKIVEEQKQQEQMLIN